MNNRLNRRHFIEMMGVTAGATCLLSRFAFAGTPAASVKIDMRTRQGAVKPVNGICNGPITFGGLIDSSPYFRKATFPYCRLHDTNWPHPREVDVHTIFKDFEADADDPAHYDFRTTDEYINSIEAVGAKVIYRLGTSIEHTKIKYYTHPPADFNKWAKICLNIARHYNEGWADGFRKNILYWEVWNEPDLSSSMWAGTPKQYFELYATVARLFKKEMPNVKIGGYASSWSNSFKINDFLQYTRENNLPLDFFSWHIYASSVQTIRDLALFVREQLDLYGFTKTESILDEWNYLRNHPNVWDLIMYPGDDALRLERRELLMETSGIIGASFTAAALIEMAGLPIDVATFYDGQPVSFFGTIFDRWGVPTKQFYAFDAFNSTITSGERVLAESHDPNVYVLAAVDGKDLRMMIASHKGKAGAFPLEIIGLDQKAHYKYTLHILDERHDFEKVEEQTGLAYADIPRSINLQADSVAMITLSVR